MRKDTRNRRKSERLRKNQRLEVSSESDFCDPDLTDPENRPVVVLDGGGVNVDRRSRRSPLSSDQEPETERPDSEDHPMSRLRYKRFKGDGSQDVDDWLCEFESTALANQENEAAQRRIFQGLLKGEALRWYQDVPDLDRNDWDQLRTDFLQAFREVGGEARALGRLSTLKMKSSESVRRYGQRAKALIQKLTTDIAPSLQVEWYVAGLPESMGFLIRQTRPKTLRDAMDAATNYENSAQSLRKSLRRNEKQERGRRKKDERKSKRREKISDSESNSSRSGTEVSDPSSSSTDEERSISPPRRLSKSKGPRDKAVVKVKTEDTDSKKMMRSIQESLEAIKVNLAENRKPRRIVPTSRSNVWCGRCGEPGHYPSECQRTSQKQVHYVYPEEELYYAIANEEEEEVYQIQPTYARGKGIAVPIRSNMLNRNFLPGTSQGVMVPTPMRAPGYPDRQVICYSCGEPGHYANSCPNKGPGLGAPRILPCQNCQEYGHQEEQCSRAIQPRPVYKQVQILPREQTALNYGHSHGTENPEK